MKQHHTPEIVKEYTPRKDHFKFVLMIIMAAFFAVMVVIMAAGCNTAKHNLKRQNKAMSKFDKQKSKCDKSEVLTSVPLKWSLKNFPTKTKYRPGKVVTNTVTDTVHEPGKTIYIECPDKTVQKVQCPPTKTIVQKETTAVHDTIEVVDTRATDLLTIKNDSLNTLLIKKDEMLATKGKEMVSWRQYAVTTWVVCAGVLLFAIVGWLLKSWLGKKGAI